MILGTYHDFIFERSTHAGPLPDDLLIGDVATLGSLRPLLVPGDHVPRLEAGDRVVALMIGDRPVALQWLNCSLHQDRYLGRASRPTSAMAYINQSVVAPDFRNQGLMHRLMAATLPVAHGLGVARVRAFVDSSNAAMISVMKGVGFVVVGRQRGARVGSRLTLRRDRWTGHDDGPDE